MADLVPRAATFTPSLPPDVRRAILELQRQIRELEARVKALETP